MSRQAPKLHFGPYKTPVFRYGATVVCEVRGEVRIVGLSDDRIPWPIGRPQGTRAGRALVVYKGLARAIRKESGIAVCYWFGMAAGTASKYRGALGVEHNNEGTHRLRRELGKSEWFAAAQRKAWSKARDPVRREKIAAARRGKPRPRHVIEAMRQANLGRPLAAATRRKQSQAHKRRGTRPPAAGEPWSATEDALVRRKLSAKEIAKRTGRTLSAVWSRRQALGVQQRRAK